jgi:hypothetical protein
MGKPLGKYTRFEFLTRVNMSMTVSWVVMPCGLVGANVLEEHIASIFSPKDVPPK